MIRDWLDSVIGDVWDASSGSELRVNCPFCETRVGKPDDKHHMYVSQINPVAMCFRCTWQGNYVSLIISATGCSYAEALVQLESPTPNVSRFPLLTMPSGLLGVASKAAISKPGGFQSFGVEAKSSREELAVWAYLRRRQIPQALIRKYMGWAPGTNRAWILIDADFWQGRLIIPGDPKYISPPWPKGDSLWNSGALNTRQIVICEGVFSAIAVGSQAVAICGKTMTIPQANRIARSKRVKSITIMLDADATQQAYGIAKMLEEAGYAGVMKIHRLKSGDPTDGLDGDVIAYDWAAAVRGQILMTV